MLQSPAFVRPDGITAGVGPTTASRGFNPVLTFPFRTSRAVGRCVFVCALHRVRPKCTICEQFAQQLQKKTYGHSPMFHIHTDMQWTDGRDALIGRWAVQGLRVMVRVRR